MGKNLKVHKTTEFFHTFCNKQFLTKRQIEAEDKLHLKLLHFCFKVNYITKLSIIYSESLCAQNP